MDLKKFGQFFLGFIIPVLPPIAGFYVLSLLTGQADKIADTIYVWGVLVLFVFTVATPFLTWKNHRWFAYGLLAGLSIFVALALVVAALSIAQLHP